MQLASGAESVLWKEAELGTFGGGMKELGFV